MARDARRSAEIGILGGTGLYDWPGLGDVQEVDVDTPYGRPSATIRLGTVAGRPLAFLARHGTHHTLLPSEIPYRANIWALRSLGVRKVLSPSAVGSLNATLPPQSLVVPDQILDRTRQRADTFFGEGLVAHVSLADPFSPGLRTALLEGARRAGHPARDGGTYLCMEGPQFSTRAESRWYRAMGCDVIGMTCVTEARLCREAEIAFASLSMVTDFDAWREAEEAVSAAEILAVLRENAAAALAILGETISLVPAGDLPEMHALATALVTPLDAVPAATLERLRPLLAPYRETRDPPDAGPAALAR